MNESNVIEPSGIPYKSHGEGSPGFSYGTTVLESSARIFNPSLVKIGQYSYVGHGTILKGYPKNGGRIEIGNRVWIGENCYIHGAGGVLIEDGVGIGPGAYILTSFHDFDMEQHEEIMRNPISFSPVTIRKGADIGFGTKICPGVTIGVGAQIGVGSVVTKNIPDFAVAYGVPCKIHRFRTGRDPLFPR